MKYFLKILAFFLAAILLSSCGPAPATQPETTVEATGTESEPIPDEEQQLYAHLFDPEYKVELNLRMEEDQLALLQADYEEYSGRGSQSPIYRMADLDVTLTAPDGSVTTYTVEQVGVRMKGNTSRTSFYNAQEGIYNLIHLKLNFQQTFDDGEIYGENALVWADEASREARKDRTFATLEKLDLRWNKCNDGTYIRESYAFQAFRASGVLAPNTTLASVDWAGLHCGIYTLCEPVDKVFLARNLTEEQLGGDLYKLGWTSQGADFRRVSSMGVEDEESGAFYTYDLKTNKKSSNHESLTALITGLNSENLTKERLEALVDMDYFLAFAAVSYLLGNPDDLRSNYNNCYIYFPPEGGCIFIPTDYDRCLGLTHEWNPTGDAVSTDDPFSTTLNATGGEQESPLWLYTVCRGGYYVGVFAAVLEEISQSQWFSADHFASIFAQAEALYGDLTTPAKEFYNTLDHTNGMSLGAEDGNMTVSTYFAAKQGVLERALAQVDTEVDVQIPARCYIRADFTQWDIDPAYAMTPNADGTYTIILSGGTFKVYDKLTDRWFGSECLSDTSLPWDTDQHTNIILPRGSYRVIFDPEGGTIILEG